MPSKYTPRTRLVAFWRKVHAREDGCWEWVAARDKLGYGKFWSGTRLMFAHRWAYEQLIGPIPRGLEPDHLCRFPSCVNPTHIELITHRENIRRGYASVPLKTHCAKGHPYSGSNLYIKPDGGRECRTCHRAWGRNWARKDRLRRM